MQGDVSGVRITPPILEFYDTKPDNVFQLTVNVKNISKISRNIRYYGPKSQKFSIKVKNPDQPVAPGLSVQAIIEYEPTDKNEVKDRLVITVDGDVIEVPIRAFPSQPVLELEKSVNFGHIVATSRVIGREIALINHGSLTGQFKLEYNGNKHLSAHPASGSVPPNSVQIIKIECVTKEPGKLDETFSVTLEGQEDSILRVTGNIVKRSLQLVSIHDEQTIECVKFGSTYYGTDKTEYAILHNNGPETINFVAIMDEEAEAQELGVDLSQTTAAALAEESSSGLSKGSTNILTSLITAIPNQGVLRPYEKIPIFFRFSPRWYSSKQGWKCQVTPPPRKDFALFMRLQIIGSNNGISNQKDDVASGNKDGCFAEVALTGTALPVLLDISPAPVFDFGECLVGEHADVLFTLKNDSTILPVTFQFKRIAHFSTHPPSGKISPGQTQDVIFSFSPRQVGTFTPQQLVDVLGHIADNRNPTLTHLKVIHVMGIKFKGTSDPVVIKPSPRFNPGITPMISNEVGLYVDETTFVKLDTNKPRNALIGANKTRLHALKSATTSRDDEDDDDSQVRIAYPNDRAQSIRPTDKRERYKTIFTKAERHHYIDPDYAYTDEEEENIRQHSNKYLDFIRNLRENRLNKQKHSEFTKTNNSVDIGLKSAGGLRPFTIKTDHIKPDPQIPPPPNANWKLLSAKELSEIEKIAMTRNVSEGLNAVPTTLQEKKDCSKWLTPQQLHQLVIGPSTIDFSKVCLRSVSQKDIVIINNLDQFVHIVAEIDCKELRQSSPLSQVLPPMSKAVIPVIFESSIQGTFQRSVLYTVNGFYQDHVTVLAEVVPVSIELSTQNLVLKPTIGSPADAGIRGVITLYNRYNHNADFGWSPKIGEKGTAFSIRPASGSVKAFKSLDCEVVWHPSYLAPLDGEFSLDIIGGTSVPLQCYAELGHSNVHFVERRIMFGQVPVNLSTVRTALLHNTGPNHAYFQVLDPNPFPGLTVSPVHGVIPVGGTTEIKVALTPDAVLKFDTRIQISIKGGKCIELRMGGTVESPAVDIDLPSFHLGGVYCGSGTQVPFKLINKTVTKAKVEFDLTRFKDFTLNFPGSQSQDDYTYQMMNPGMYSVGLRPEEVITGELTFMPREVAAYDFIMPVVVNHIGAPSPAPTPFPPTPVPSQKNSLEHIINPRPRPAIVVTPRKHVVATALRQPLQLSTNRIEFNLPSSFNDVTMNTGFGGSKNFVLVNNSDKMLKWALDLSQPSRALDEGILKFLHPTGLPFMKSGSGCGIEGELDPGKTQSIVILFCPNAPGRYEAVVPIIVNEEWTKPYQYLQVMGELKAPKIWFDPPSLCLTPVPLLTEISGEFNLLASQYKKVTPLDVELPQVECEDGSKISPLKISFSQGHDIQPCCGDSGQMDPCSLRCKVTFVSTKPISFSQPIIFKDTEGQSFKIFITATADNCILSCYPFLALHRTDHQIVCEQDIQNTCLKNQAVAGDVASGETDEATADAQAVVEECEAELAECEESLAEALPAVEAALSALNALPKSDIVLIRSMINPPALVKLVLESICVILGIKPERRPVEGQAGKMVEDFWIPSKKLLAYCFLDRMRNFDKDNIPSGVMKRVREKYLSNPEFEPNYIKKVSAACEGLCRWVQAIDLYDKVAKIIGIGPKKAKLAEAESALSTQMEKLNANRGQEQVGSVPKGRRIQGSITSDSVGEAIIVPCHTPPRSHSRQSTSATSSNFQISSSSYESSIDCTDGTEGTTPLNRDGAMNKQQMVVEQNGRPIQEIPSRSVGSAMFPDEDTEEGQYHTEVLMAVQRWFTANGWPGGPFPIQIPYTLRISLSKKKDDEKRGGSWDTTSVKKDVKTIYDMISHLSGRPVPGIPVNASFPANPVERVKQIYWQHSTLLTFIRCQGGSVSGIRPEHLMELGDCILWKELQAEIKRGLLQQGKTAEAGNIIDSEPIDDEDVFEALSKRAWTDLLLQIMKCLVLAKVTPRTLKNIATPTPGVTMPIVNPDPLCSNIYCVGERIILTWLNHHYEQYRHKIWKNSTKGGVPASRWIVNYDMDLLDGLVVASVLGAHLSFLVDDYLSDMYTHPSTAEQCLHNALKIVNAMRFAGIEYDIQAIDITDPNPVSMLFLCMHLYQKLPQYLPKDDIDFTGSLHSTVTRQVKLTNSSNKSLNYHVLLAGRDAKDFRVPKGDHVTVPPKTTYPLSVEHVSRFLRPAEAVLVLVGRRQGSTTGTTMTFQLHTQIDNITPLPSSHYQMTMKTESPCYELERIILDVTNPFNEGGEFKIILMETNMDTSDPSKPAAASVLLRTKDKKKKKVKAKIDHGQNRPETPPTPPPPVITDTQQLAKTKKDDEAMTLSAFSSPMKTFYLEAGGSAEVQVDFLPFFTGDRQCSVIFLNDNIGEFLYSIEAKATLPLPSPLPFLPNQNTIRISSAAPYGNGRGLQGGEETVIYWKCDSGQPLKQTLLIPVTNMTKEKALILAAQQRMSELEIQRRSATGTLTSSSVAAKTVKLLSSGTSTLAKTHKTRKHNYNKYTVEVDSEYYKIPSSLSMPSPLDARSHSAPTSTRIPQGIKIEDGIVELPVTFKAKTPGHYPAEIILRAVDDIRVYHIETTVNPDGSMAELELSIPVNQSLTQNIPIVNLTNHDWPLRAEITGDGFSGPPSHLAKAYQTAQYPLVYKPLYETPVKGKLVLSNIEDGTDHVFIYISG
ncbi:cilia and flagella-associated protein 47 [Patella vulgata]|uniref:cilia and flagella-associated protein 47 n=1 Tax=Patella vulgata TaxID=6465 RepID=UPI0024A8E906|nr:cilia and flagella-associated protein 47 [Patella vulgata]